MKNALSTARLDALRSDARQIVRDLGFMQKGLAGTSLSPSAVHTIIELGLGTVSNAAGLAALLHLEKSSVSRLLQKLEQDGLIDAGADSADRRARRLALTEQGRALFTRLEAFGRSQIRTALASVPERDAGAIETGLGLFAKALSGTTGPEGTTAPAFRLCEGYRSGIIASVVQLHAAYYSDNYGFGAIFERKVATEMSEFMGRIGKPGNTVFSAFRGDDLLGSVSLDGEDLGHKSCHLRWFVVSPRAHGMGIGSRLMEKAMAFVDRQAFAQTRLWTFKGLDAARHIYEKHGFELVHETPGSQWGTEVIEQEFARKSRR